MKLYLAILTLIMVALSGCTTPTDEHDHGDHDHAMAPAPGPTQCKNVVLGDSDPLESRIHNQMGHKMSISLYFLQDSGCQQSMISYTLETGQSLTLNIDDTRAGASTIRFEYHGAEYDLPADFACSHDYLIQATGVKQDASQYTQRCV